MIAHLNACASTRSPRYVCNCGADAQNATATKLDQAESTRKADAIDRRWGVDPEAERRLDAMLRETRPAAVPPPDLAADYMRRAMTAYARHLERIAGNGCAARIEGDAIDLFFPADLSDERFGSARDAVTRAATIPLAIRDIRRGFVPIAQVPPDVLADIDRPPPPVRVDTPLHAAARMLDRLHARACHHDSPRHLLATAYGAVELAATLSPAEAIRVLDGVEPYANEPTHSKKPDTPKSP